MNRRIVLPASACLAALTIGLVSLAGPINPPAGPIVPTNKTLQEVFDKAGAAESRIAINATNTPGDADSLFKIVNPGSYYLTGNITGVVGKHGIEIAASGVTLDLNGFELLGVAGMGDFDGVSATVQLSANIAVVNGSVRAWGGAGVDLHTQVIFQCRVERIIASSNFGFGIGIGHAGTVSLCSASSNGGNGILTRFVSLVSQCVMNGNGGSGIATGEGCTVIDNTSRNNFVDGIVVPSDCLVRGNNCSDNGLNAGDGAGIHAASTDNRIEGNICTGADRGIDVDGPGNIVLRNTCSGNATNWDVVAGNVILVITATPAAAVVGNAGGVAPGSTDPNANFTY